MPIVEKPIFKIQYNGKDITADLSEHLLNVIYTDNVIGKADELEFTVEDSDAIWLNEWYPSKGDKLHLQMGYDDMLTDCSDFTIDEIEYNTPPDTVTIKAIATWVTTPLRTKKSGSFESQTLRQIVAQIAKRNGLTVDDGSKYNPKVYNGYLYTIRLVRSTQDKETDLEYLNRLGNEYGFIFTVIGTKLVAQSIFDIEAGNPVFEISRSQLKSANLKDKTSLSYKDCEVVSHNPITRKTPQFKFSDAKNADGIPFREATSADTLVIKSRTENSQQAEAKARVALYKSKTQQVEGTITVVGYPLLVSGNNFELTDMGQFSGKYHILKSVHTNDRDNGYTTDLEIKRVGYVLLIKNKKPRKKKPATYRVEVIK